MATLAPGGRHLVSLEEIEEFYCGKIERLLACWSDEGVDFELLDALCNSICFVLQGIEQGQDKGRDQTEVVVFNPDTRRLTTCRK